MAVYVDPLTDFGWKIRGHLTPSCHLFTAGGHSWLEKHMGDRPICFSPHIDSQEFVYFAPCDYGEPILKPDIIVKIPW